MLNEMKYIGALTHWYLSNKAKRKSGASSKNDYDAAFANIFNLIDQKDLPKIKRALKRAINLSPEAQESLTTPVILDELDEVESLSDLHLLIEDNKSNKLLLRTFLNSTKSIQRDLEIENKIIERLSVVTKKYNLTDDESEILRVVVSSVDNDIFYEFGTNPVRVFREINYLTTISIERISKALEPKSNLRKRLLTPNRDRHSRRAGDPTIPLELLQYVVYGNGDGLADLYFKELDVSSAFDLISFPVTENEISVTKVVLDSKRGENILFHGEAGTGKTELTKALARKFNKRLYTLSFKSDDDDNRFAHLKVAIPLLDELPDNSILLIDEADSILNTIYSGFLDGSRIDKGELNTLLEEHKSKIVWITNDVGRIEDSVLRRFQYSIKFKMPDLKRKMEMLDYYLEKGGAKDLFSLTETRMISRKFQLRPSVISRAISYLPQLEDSIEEKKRFVLSHFEKHHQVIYGAEPKELDRTASNYDPFSLNIVGSNIIDIVTNVKKVSDFPSDRRPFKNYNILLTGPSGTGKTEFVKYVSETTDLPLIVKRGSDLLSKYIGETEQQIAAAFREAERANGILLLDEADSLIFGRESAERSYEISMVNEFLGQMENFKGVLFCTTNFERNIDQAMIRRFAETIRFDYLDDEGKKRLFSEYFPQCDVDKVCKELLGIRTITPGDFLVVKKRCYFNDSLCEGDIIRELENISKERTKRIGREIKLM